MEEIFMRMMKRLAVCVLAAAMSLTMLTACGDDAPTAPSNPSNPGTSQGSGNTGSENGSTGGSGSGSAGGETAAEKTWKNSKTRATLLKAGVANTNYYISGKLIENNVTSIQPFTYAAQGNRRFVSVTQEDKTYQFYLDVAGNVYVGDGTGNWAKVTDTNTLNYCKNLFVAIAVVCNVPKDSQISDFKEEKEQKLTVESYNAAIGNEVGNEKVGYMYRFNEDGTLYSISTGFTLNGAPSIYSLTVDSKIGIRTAKASDFPTIR